MKVVIDIEKTEPLFAQLISQIKQAVMDEAIIAGDALPSIRQLANDLDVNNKTVAKAYKLLERDNVIVTKGYRGTFVHPDAKANSSADLSPWANHVLEEAVKTLRSAGVTDSEIRIAFKASMDNQNNTTKRNGD
ncbi:GntR family transcriptional regulator [Maritalea sp.]|uniref:GntR family transcriptional regulator n=1 Tax=Maritalea sp. TaxID=2003361 RepID=UPI003EF6930C